LQPNTQFKIAKEGPFNINVTHEIGSLQLRGMYSDVKMFFKQNVQVHFACLFVDNELHIARLYNTKGNSTLTETKVKLSPLSNATV